MASTLTDAQLRLLGTILERGAENASQALSQWLGRQARLTISAIEESDLSGASSLLGSEDAMVVACSMRVLGGLPGQLLLVFEDRSGLALADLLLQRPAGTAMIWGELEQSAAMETANIVGCAFLNSLSAHVPNLPGGGVLAPSPPTFLHEFAGCLLQFALMDQATRSDRVLLIRSRFTVESDELSWNLLLVPDAESLDALPGALTAATPPENQP